MISATRSVDSYMGPVEGVENHLPRSDRGLLDLVPHSITGGSIMHSRSGRADLTTGEIAAHLAQVDGADISKQTTSRSPSELPPLLRKVPNQLRSGARTDLNRAFRAGRGNPAIAR